MKIINLEEAWKYPASLLVRPEPSNVWKYDEFRPENAPAATRSDGGYIIKRLKYLEDDVDFEA